MALYWATMTLTTGFLAQGIGYLGFGNREGRGERGEGRGKGRGEREVRVNSDHF